VTVITYARWSSQEQSAGTSLERQIAECRRAAEARGWSVDEVVTDQGVSAYTGANIRSGNLAHLISDVRCGVRTGTNTTIIVENLDRLSRTDATAMVAWLTDVLNLGVTILIAKDGRKLTRQSLQDDMGTFVLIVVEAFGNNAESKKKAKRIAEYWSIAREGNSLHPNLRHPAWLENREGRLVVKDGAAALINRIFALALKGHGGNAIAKTLNQEGVRPFSFLGREAANWTATRVKRIIYNDAVIGFYTPYNRPRSGETRRAGQKIRRYPPVVDDQTFAEVQKNKSGRRPKGSISNLLPRSRCFLCKGAMGARGSSSRGHYYFYCLRAKSGDGSCNHQQGWRYGEIEKPLLDLLLDRALDDRFFAVDTDVITPLAQRVAILRTELEAKSDHLSFLLNELGRNTDVPELKLAYTKALASSREARNRLQLAETELAKLRGKASPDEHRSRVRSLRTSMESPDEEVRFKARFTIRQALDDLIDRIDFCPDTDNVVVKLVGGVGTFLILGSEGSLIEQWDESTDYSQHPRRKIIERFISTSAQPV
jgi:DNA invertase Pin-like site-specific DNA recombinase